MKYFMKKNIMKFTLIEMLVVVAIIGILASIMMPSLQNALGTARTLSCANNLKQIKISLVQYENDYNGYVCAARSMDPDGITTYRYWNDLMICKGYIPSVNLYVCPASVEFDAVGAFTRSTILSAGHTAWARCGYGMNRMVGDQSSGDVNIKRIKKNTMVRRPSKFIQLGDAAYKDNDVYRPYVLMYPMASQEAYAYPWHNTICNILYFDGHVSGEFGIDQNDLYSTAGPLTSFNTVTLLPADSPWMY